MGRLVGLSVTSQQLTLTEYVPSLAVDLTRDDVTILRRLAPRMQVVRSWDSPGRFDLTPGSEVGVVALGHTSIMMRPKVPMDRALFLVSYALNPARWQQHAGLYDTAEGVVEGMAAIFGHELRHSLQRGLLQDYRTTEDALMTVRGRIRFEDQLRRRFGRPFPIEVRFDEFTQDTEMNRVLRAALWRLSRLPIRSGAVRSLLGFCSSVLGNGVALVNYDADRLPVFHWTRLNQHYRSAVELALLILRSTSVEISEGSTTGTGFVIDMNWVFEEFVRTALREELALTPSAFPPGSKAARPLDEAGRVYLEPDLSWWISGKCVFVGDAKYKGGGLRGTSHDLYQLLAYTIALDLPGGLLVYAAGEAEPVEHSIMHVGKRLQVTAVDITGTPHDILSDVARIARQVRELRADAPVVAAL